MLDRLLKLLREEGTRRIGDLADELDTTPDLVEAMLEDLARMGYVKRIEARCSETCTACPLSGLCATGGSLDERSRGQVWILEEEERDASSVSGEV